MLFYLVLISTELATVFSLNQCQRSCESEALCFYTCKKQEIFNSKANQPSNSNQFSGIRLAFNCFIEDEEKCNKDSDTDQEYYDCLKDVGCLVANKGPELSPKLPEILWPAIQSYYQKVVLPQEELKECETCKSEYFAEDFYACVYYNCQGKLSENTKLLQFVDQASQCSKCNNRASDDQALCMWVHCRSELLSKQFLYKEIRLDNLTCTDCESIVYADQYYNCISMYCSQLFTQTALQSIQLNDQCKQCLKVEESSFSSCAVFSCKQEILSLEGGLELFNSKVQSCDLLLDENYLECVKAEEKISGVVWALFGVGLMALAGMALLWKKRPEDSYRLIVS